MQQLSQRVQPSATLAAFLSLIICVMSPQIHHQAFVPAVVASVCGATVIWYNCHKLTLVWAVLLCTLHNVAMSFLIGLHWTILLQYMASS